MTISFTISEFWGNVALTYLGIFAILAFWNLATCLSGTPDNLELDPGIWRLQGWTLLWPVVFICVIAWLVGAVFCHAWRFFGRML